MLVLGCLLQDGMTDALDDANRVQPSCCVRLSSNWPIFRRNGPRFNKEYVVDSGLGLETFLWIYWMVHGQLRSDQATTRWWFNGADRG